MKQEHMVLLIKAILEINKFETSLEKTLNITESIWVCDHEDLLKVLFENCNKTWEEFYSIMISGKDAETICDLLMQ